MKDYQRLTQRLSELHRQGLHRGTIAETLNAEGFVPPRRRGVFTELGVGALMRELGLVGDYFRDDLLKKDEWRIPDLARALRVIPQKIHYWVKTRMDSFPPHALGKAPDRLGWTRTNFVGSSEWPERSNRGYESVIRI